MDFSPYYRKLVQRSFLPTRNGTQGGFAAGTFLTRLPLKPAVRRAIDKCDETFQTALDQVDLRWNQFKDNGQVKWSIRENNFGNLLVSMVAMVVIGLAIYWVTKMNKHDNVEKIIRGPKFWIKQDQKTLRIVKNVCRFLAHHRMWFPRLNFVFVQIQPGPNGLAGSRPHRQDNGFGDRDGGLSAPQATTPPGTQSSQSDYNLGELAAYYNVGRMWTDEQCFNEVKCDEDYGTLSSTTTGLKQGGPIVVARSSSLPNALSLSTGFIDYPLYGPMSLSPLSQLVNAPTKVTHKKKTLKRKRRRGASLCSFPLVPITEVIDEAVDYEYETNKRYLTPPRLRGMNESEIMQQQEHQQQQPRMSPICQVSPWVHRNYYQPVWLYRGRRTDDRGSLAVIQDDSGASIGRSGRSLLPDPQLCDSHSSLSDASLTTTSSATSHSTSSCSSPLSSLSYGPPCADVCMKNHDDCFNKLLSNDQPQTSTRKPLLSKARFCLQRIAESFSMKRSNSNCSNDFVLQGRDHHS